MNTGQKHCLWKGWQGSGLSLQWFYTGRIFIFYGPCHMINFALSLMLNCITLCYNNGYKNLFEHANSIVIYHNMVQASHKICHGLVFMKLSCVLFIFAQYDTKLVKKLKFLLLVAMFSFCWNFSISAPSLFVSKRKLFMKACNDKNVSLVRGNYEINKSFFVHRGTDSERMWNVINFIITDTLPCRLLADTKQGFRNRTAKNRIKAKLNKNSLVLSPTWQQPVQLLWPSLSSSSWLLSLFLCMPLSQL